MPVEQLNIQRKKEEDKDKRRRDSQTDFNNSGKALGNPRKGRDKCLRRDKHFFAPQGT